MTTTDQRATQVLHPPWCEFGHEHGEHAEGGGWANLGPVDPEETHRGRDYRLDAGETFANATTVRAVEMFEERDGEVIWAGGTRIELTVAERELGQEATVHLTLAEARILVAHLETVISDVERWAAVVARAG